MNPFSYGNPVTAERFIGRRNELRRVVNRLLGGGQSTALTGEPRIGKTSLLVHLAADANRATLYGDVAERLLFCEIDNEALSMGLTQAQFWQMALRPLYERAVQGQSGPLAKAYRRCQLRGFGSSELNELIEIMRQDGWRLVLLLDEFDALVNHPVLSAGDFFGSLRSLASRSSTALAVVLASRQPLEQLDQATQKFNPSGSPYFNFLSEVKLGVLDAEFVALLLNRAGDRFTPGDRDFIIAAGGGHPYLLQVAAYEMWEAYEEGQTDPAGRWQRVGENLYDEAARTLADTWRLWPPMVRVAFTTIALPQMTLDDRQFNERNMLRSMRDFGPELPWLEKRGFICEDQAAATGWRVCPQAFLWWLADELVRMVRDEPAFQDWLRREEWEGLLTRGEREQLRGTAQALGGMLKGSAQKLIETVVLKAASGLPI